jgi:hypothetical protein
MHHVLDYHLVTHGRHMRQPVSNCKLAEYVRDCCCWICAAQIQDTIGVNDLDPKRLTAQRRLESKLMHMVRPLHQAIHVAVGVQVINCSRSSNCASP